MIDADVHECWACVHNNCGCDTWCEYGEAFELREDVKNAPTIEAAPVVHAEWVGVGFGKIFECSNCGYLTDYRSKNFCPKCGADMRKKV